MVSICLALAFVIGAPSFARAEDEVAQLAKMLSSSSSDKARLAAVTALARIDDKRTLKPLATALHDPNAQIRALAATALGKLGHKAALAGLRNAANDDPDDTVRARAKDAAIAVAKANHIEADVEPAAEAPAVATQPVRKGRAGFGHNGHAVDEHPDLYILVSSSSDDSPGKLDKAERKVHCDVLKKSLTDQLRSNPSVTLAAADAQRWNIDPRHVDLSIIKMEVNPTGNYMEAEAQLRLAISDDKGRMLSFLSGGAKVQVSKRTFNASQLPQLRKEALQQAMQGMFDKLLTQLRSRSQS
jgi:hypothetical protein